MSIVMHGGHGTCCVCVKNPDRSVLPAEHFDPEKKVFYCDDHVPAAKPITIKQHSGNKYIRRTIPPEGCEPGEVDVYAVLEAFGVTCPATQHALKKLLCAGLRGKGDRVKDLTEAIDALRRAVEMEQARIA